MKHLEQLADEILEKGNLNGEQTSSNDNEISSNESNGSNKNPVQEITSNAGSENLGKFKDVESLIKAYNSLQTEFTKKSQRLSELENAMVPFTKSEKIEMTLDELGKRYSLSDSIKNQIKENLVATDSDDYTRLAEQNLLKIYAGSFKNPEELIKDKAFLSNYIFNNDDIKGAIIKEYLKELNSATTIKVATNFNSIIPATPPAKIKTIDEAGDIAKSIIKKLN